MDIVAALQEFEWTDPRTVPGVSGPMQVQEMVDEPDEEFWSLWRRYKQEMRDYGISCGKDEDTGLYKVSWFHRHSMSTPQIRQPLPQMAKVLNVIDDEGAGTLDPVAFDILKVRQRKAAMTLFAAYTAGLPFALDASQMGQGKTYIALGLLRTLGLNFGIVCPANVVTKWTDTAIEPFGLEPEFILSYDKARSGKHEQYVSRIALAKSWMFRWNCFEPVVLIFDEVHVCASPDSLNAMMLQAAVTNPNVFVLGLSGTAANNPVEMRVLGQALGLHGGTDFFQWAKRNGCYDNPWGGLDFTRNQQKSIQHLSKIHAHIFPARGCRLLKADSKGEGVPPHEIFVAPVDTPEELPKQLAPFVAAVETAKEDDGDESLAIVQSIRERQLDELALVPYAVAQAVGALEDGQSVAIFATYADTIRALGEMLKDHKPMFYTGTTSHQTKTDNLRQFQAHVRPLILINVEAGSAGIDLHDTSGIHPRYSIIFPTYKARTLLQAIDRTDRLGKKSLSQVELLFRTVGIHLRMMKAVQRKIDNLSLLHDGELSPLTLCPTETPQP